MVWKREKLCYTKTKFVFGSHSFVHAELCLRQFSNATPPQYNCIAMVLLWLVYVLELETPNQRQSDCKTAMEMNSCMKTEKR